MPTTDSNEEDVLEYIAMNIVHQIGDALYDALPKDIAHDYFVDARQETNDITIDFAKRYIASHMQTIGNKTIGSDLDMYEWRALKDEGAIENEKIRETQQIEQRQRLTHYLGRNKNEN